MAVTSMLLRPARVRRSSTSSVDVTPGVPRRSSLQTGIDSTRQARLAPDSGASASELVMASPPWTGRDGVAIRRLGAWERSARLRLDPVHAGACGHEEDAAVLAPGQVRRQLGQCE